MLDMTLEFASNAPNRVRRVETRPVFVVGRCGRGNMSCSRIDSDSPSLEASSCMKCSRDKLSHPEKEHFILKESIDTRSRSDLVDSTYCLLCSLQISYRAK